MKRGLKVILAILSVCLLCTVFAACGGGNDPVTLTIDKNTVEVYAGATVRVKVTPSRELEGEEAIEWKSDKTDIATVDKNGTVKGVAPGQAVITATIGDSSVSCTVTVKKRITLTLDIDKATLNVEEDENKAIQLTATCNEEGTITWSSSDETFATVDQNGLVTSVVNPTTRRGTAIITASAHNLSATCEITVINPSAPEVYDIQRGTTNATIAKDPGKWYYFNKTSDGAQIATPTATYNSSKENGDNIEITYAYIGATNTAGQMAQNYLRYQPDLPVGTQYVFRCMFTSTVAGEIEIGTGNTYTIPANVPTLIIAQSTISDSMPLNIKLMIFGGTEEEPENITFTLNNMTFTAHNGHSYDETTHECICGEKDPNYVSGGNEGEGPEQGGNEGEGPEQGGNEGEGPEQGGNEGEGLEQGGNEGEGPEQGGNDGGADAE